MNEYEKWKARLAQAARDLEELQQQLDENEIPPDTGQRLRELYLEEMERARLRLSETTSSAMRNPETTEEDQKSTPFWTQGRAVIAALLAIAALTLVVTVGSFTQPDEQPVGNGEDFDPSQYSNETMEAVIAANAEHPQINGMRLALAARYFQAGDFSGAFTQYRGVLERNPTPGEEAEALGHLGWMAWAGSGEAQLAIETLDRALGVAPDHPQVLYFKAIVLWCGTGQPGLAVPLLEKVVEALPTQTAVASELAAAQAEEECS